MKKQLSTKTIVFILLVILFIGGLGYGAYRYFISPQPDPNNNQSSQIALTVIEPSGKYIKYTSQELKGISFEYPDNWILTPAKDENGQITIRNFKEGSMNQFGDKAIEIKISSSNVFGSDGLSTRINTNNFPTYDKDGNLILKTERFYTDEQNTLIEKGLNVIGTIKQETSDSYLVYLSY